MAYSQNQFIQNTVQLAFKINAELAALDRQAEGIQDIQELAFFINQKAREKSYDLPFDESKLIAYATGVGTSAQILAVLSGDYEQYISWVSLLTNKMSSLDTWQRHFVPLRRRCLR